MKIKNGISKDRKVDVPFAPVGFDAVNNAVTLGATAEQFAQGTLTSDATAPANNATVTIGSRVYTYVALTQGTTTLTSDNTAPADGSTVTIGNKTYTFKTTLTPTEGEVLINTTADAALLNLIRAINHTGTPDTDYKCAAAHTQVSAASSVTSHAFLITALDAGTAGNVAVSASTSAPSAHITFTAATLTGGTDPTVADTVKIGVSAATALDNLKAAVNLDIGSNGTLFYVTAPHPDVTATTNTDTTQLFVAKVAGPAGNAIVTSETSSHLSFGATTLVGGANAALNVAGSYAFNNITSATTTVVKTGAGVLHSLIFNKRVAAGVVTIYDNTTNSGTKIGTITAPGTLLSDPPTTVLLDVEFKTGLTIVTSAADDITVTFR